MDERACNGDALHLAAGELVRKAIAEAFEFDPGQPISGGFAWVVLSGEEQRQFDVFRNRQRVKQSFEASCNETIGIWSRGRATLSESPSLQLTDYTLCLKIRCRNDSSRLRPQALNGH